MRSALYGAALGVEQVQQRQALGGGGGGEHSHMIWSIPPPQAHLPEGDYLSLQRASCG